MAERTDTRKQQSREQPTQFSLVTFKAYGLEATGTHVVLPGGNRGFTNGMYGEDGRQRALAQLAEGGYVVDLTPLAEHPNLTE